MKNFILWTTTTMAIFVLIGTAGAVDCDTFTVETAMVAGVSCLWLGAFTTINWKYLTRRSTKNEK